MNSNSTSQLVVEAEDFNQKLQKRGVIYISRVPPLMKPNKARILLEEYGEVTRIYLAEEDSSRRQKRKSHGGNGSKQFVEGWVEYADKKVAKSVAESLNNTPIGGKKGDFYHDDIWNLKYLRGFKWDYLTEKLAYERRVREAKLQTAMLQAKRQSAEYAELVEKDTLRHQIEEKKRKRADIKGSTTDQQSGSNVGPGNSTTAISDVSTKKRREFKQARPISIQHGERGAKIESDVLQSIFVKK